MFNIRFHAGARRENGPFVEDRSHAEVDIKRDDGFVSAWPGIPRWNTARGEIPRLRDDEAALSWFLLSDLLLSPADLPLRSCARLHLLQPSRGKCSRRRRRRRRSGKRASGLHPKKFIFLRDAGYSRTTLAENPEASLSRASSPARFSFSRDFFLLPRENKMVACVAFFLN